MLQMQGTVARSCRPPLEDHVLVSGEQSLARTNAITINTSSHYHPITFCQLFLVSGNDAVALTQKPARARCLEVRRKTTKVEARAMSATIVPSILSPWSACKLKPGWCNSAAGRPDMLDGPDMAGSRKML